MSSSENPVRRVSIDIRKPPLRLTLGFRPTIIVAGRGQPTQWGVGTWQLPADADNTIIVYLHLRGITVGRAEYVLRPTDDAALEYRAPTPLTFRARLAPPRA
ncbi:hypothetical protein BH10ACT7_BH10ACT7_32820 [soil metagenome]